VIPEKELREMLVSRPLDRRFFTTLDLEQFIFLRELFKELYKSTNSSDVLNENFLHFSIAWDQRCPDSETTPADDILDI
jgi:hypothetical protein